VAGGVEVAIVELELGAVARALSSDIQASTATGVDELMVSAAVELQREGLLRGACAGLDREERDVRRARRGGTFSTVRVEKLVCASAHGNKLPDLPEGR
jgi:hypothetical protein